jgi:phosphate transport system permease protein
MVIVLLGLIAWWLGWQRARSFAPAGGIAMRMPALPSQHASFLMLCTVVPALLVAAIWPSVSSRLIMRSILTLPAAKNLPASPMDRDSVLSEAAGLADGSVEGAFNPLSYELAKPIAEASHFYTITGAVLLVALALIGFAIGYFRLKPAFKARQKVEAVVMLCLMLASLVALVTTFGIVASLVFETGRFFTHVPVTEFLFSTHWAPASDVVASENNGFGAVPLFWGTIFIGAIIAMIVAIPLGLMSAVYLTQYASATARKVLKPVLEILAGIPTVVYGYFAALTVAPLVRDFAGALGKANPSTESALAAGLVMGVMIIPFVSSMADDSIAAVPQAMRDGSLAMGATQSETIKRVLLPAALPGIVAGVMLAVSRAIGETMIVVMAAGAAARLSANPFDSMTTVTYQIVQLLTGDQEFSSPKTLSAFALGLVLFVITLILNIVALRVVKRFREAYE